MSRDYKPHPGNTSSGPRVGLFLLGMVIGLVLGLAIAVGVAWYINNKIPSPFLAQGKPAENPADKGAPAKPEVAKPTIQGLPQADERQANRPRFEFYKILPGSEEPASEQDLKQSGQQPLKDAYFLQAGAFQNAADADNLKAKLALLGMEASIQTANLPDKGIWHRVRVGPYTSIEDFDRARAMLKQNGIDASLIKVREAPKQ